MGKGWEWKEGAEWKEGREWKKGAGMGNEEWGGTEMKIERGRKIKALPIPAKAGISHCLGRGGQRPHCTSLL